MDILSSIPFISVSATLLAAIVAGVMRFSRIEHRAEANEKSIAELKHQVNDLRALTEVLARLDERMKHMANSIEEIKKTIKTH